MDNNGNLSSNLQTQNSNSNMEMSNKLRQYNNNINSNGYNADNFHNSGYYNNEDGLQSEDEPQSTSGISDKDIKKQKRKEDSEAVRAAADTVAKTGHPAAMAVGKGIKAADKLTGGRSSELIAKADNKLKKNLAKTIGKSGLAFANKLAESGAIDKLNKIESAKNGSLPSNSANIKNKKANMKPPQPSGSDLDDAKKQKRKTEESYDDGTENFKVSIEKLKKVAILGVPVFILFVFMVLLVAGSQAFLQANTLGQADSVSQEDAEENIDNIDGSKLDDEIKDEDADENVSYIDDIYVENEKTFEKYEFTAKQIINNQEASLEDLEDFYPEIINYTSDEYNQNDVYKFFKKLYYINKYYSAQGVTLDIPLIMSVLRLQSDDMGVVFKANTSEYTKEDIETGENNPDFQIDKDWSSYKSTKNNSAHDIEVLAQAMAKNSDNTSLTQDGNYIDGVTFMEGKFGKIYYYNQGDYYDKPYGSYGTIASHGCGPTSLAIVISSFKDEPHDPVEITNYVCETGGCTDGGTAWSQMESTPKHYGLKSRQTTSANEVVSALGSGNALVIAIMSIGHFTSGGHYIVLTGVTSDGKVTVADPASRERSKEWDFNLVYEEACYHTFWIIESDERKINNNNNSNKNNTNNSSSNTKSNDGKVISNVPKINQYNEGLPTGCETVSAVMLMQYYNASIDSKDFAKKYLIKKNLESGKGPDPNSAFVGSPASNDNSFGIYAPAMTDSMNKFLKTKNLVAKNISGNSISSLINNYINKGNPVMVWATMGMEQASDGASWTINYVDSNAKYKIGDKFVWKRPEHCLVLVGYDKEYYYLNDPATGRMEKYSKNAVEASYNSMGKQAIIIDRS